jgi:hypothetical protein
MTYKITRHSTAAAPEDALDLLEQRLGPRREDISFRRTGSSITATFRDDDAPVAMTRDERTDIGRRAVLKAVGEVCERAPGLQLDWYAVSPAGN